MSLLLDALKKAEKAKEEAQRRAKGADAAASPFDPEATVLDDGKHVTRRDELPDISAPLEILSEDLRSGTQAKAAPLELALAEEPAPAPETKTPPRRENRRAQAEASNAERITAQRVFEAKVREPNPRMPFYITVGVLGAFALGTVAYFWAQLRPAPSLVNTNPARSADEKPVAAAAPTAAPAPGLGQASQGPGAIAGLPATPSVQTPAAAATATPAAAATAASPVGAPATAAPAVAAARTPRSKPAAANNDERPLTINRGGPQIHPQVSAGYAAYQSGDLTKAREAYLLALRDEPANRDALLGLAAVEMRSQRYDLADGYYQRVLQSDPRDPNAQAGMLALRGRQLDPVQIESRVKSLIAADSGANVLYFTLGNQYAEQGRWAEAQQAYFKAFATDPDNPDFAFNLAVSIDQLRQPKLALEYYRRALALAEKRNADFDLDSARTRVQQLSR
jgi:tetratricopeptide (TPR) repeat protein